MGDQLIKSKQRVVDHGEVFTSVREVNAMLDLVKQEAERFDSRFLEPACGNGNFLAAILQRKLRAATNQCRTSASDYEKNAVIAVTSLYGIDVLQDNVDECRRRLLAIFTQAYEAHCKKEASAACREAVWLMLNRNIWCGDALTLTGANGGPILFPEKFDVIIGNPPYHSTDGGNGMSAKPIYQHFVNQAKKLNPKYVAMIIPARWFAGGKGLDGFRKSMLNDTRIRKLVDFENSAEVFPEVDVAGGICYFLWERDSEGLCEVTNYDDGQVIVAARPLNELDTFVRSSRAVPIVRKVLAWNTGGKFLNEAVSARKPFGLPTNYVPKDAGVPCWFIQRIGLKYAAPSDVSDTKGLLGKWKLLVPKAPIAGQTDFSRPVGFYGDRNVRIAKPGECCTESWLVAGAFGTEREVLSFKSYLFTKTVRFLILQTVVSQDVTKKNFCFVPDLSRYEGEYTDGLLRAQWDITDAEWAFIDSRISSIHGHTGGSR